MPTGWRRVELPLPHGFATWFRFGHGTCNTPSPVSDHAAEIWPFFSARSGPENRRARRRCLYEADDRVIQLREVAAVVYHRAMAHAFKK